MVISSLPRPLNGTNVVTASELVRHFGIWQDRATREPVYVLHRGRPRLVLTSVEIMQALCAPHDGEPEAGANAGVETLLDVTRDIILLIDHDMKLIAASRAARGYFGERAQPGAPLVGLAASVAMLLLNEAAQRVMASGLVETAEYAAPFAGRTLSVTIHPCDTGAILLVHDVTVIDSLAAARAHAVAETEAMIATGMMAHVRLSLRGFLEAPVVALAVLVGVEPQVLADARFTTLFEPASRASVDAAIEAAIDQQMSRIADAMLLVAGARPRPVRLGLSPIRRGSIVEAIAVAVVVR